MKRTIVVDPDTRAGRLLLENANILSRFHKGIAVMDYTPEPEPQPGSWQIGRLLEALRKKAFQKKQVKY